MVAVAKQQNIIEIRGVDNASKEINKVAKSMAGLQKQSTKTGKAGKQAADEFGKGFADAGDAAATRAGRLSTTLSSLGDFAGKSEGSFRQASEAAGAFDDVLTLLPGPAGIAAAAVAGLTTVLVLQAREAAQTSTALKQAFGNDVAADIAKVGSALGLNREAMLAVGQAAQDTGKSVDELADDLQVTVDKAEAIGSDGSAAVIKFAKSLGEAVTDADRLRGRLRTLGVEVRQIDLGMIAGTELKTQAEKATKDFEAELAKLTDKLEKAKTEADDIASGRAGLAGRQRRRSAINKAFDSDEDRALLARFIAREKTAAQRRVQSAEAEIQALRDRRANLVASIRDSAKVEAEERIKAAERAFADAKAYNDKLAKDTADREAARRAAMATKGSAAAKRRADAERKAEQKSAELAEQNLQILLTLDRQRLETKALELKAQAALAVTDQQRITAAKALAAFEQNKALKALQAQGGTISDDQKRQRLAAIKTIGDLELKAKIKSIKDNSDKSKAEQEKKDRDAIASRIKAFGAAISAIQIGESGSAINDLQKGLAIAANGAADVAKNLDKIPQAAAAGAAAIGAIGAIAVDADTKRAVAAVDADTKQRLSTAKTEQERAEIVQEGERKKAAAVEAGERRKAAILAVMEAARAIASYPNLVEVAAHGAAAIAFGAIAGGALGTSAPSSGGSVGGAGGFSSSAAAAPGGAAGEGGGVTQVFNFNQPLVTKQTIGKAVAESQRSLRMTGHMQANGV